MKKILFFFFPRGDQCDAIFWGLPDILPASTVNWLFFKDGTEKGETKNDDWLMLHCLIGVLEKS